MMTGVRIAKTKDGRYVPVTHPDAAALAYSQHDNVPDDVMRQLSQNEPKKAEKPADKARRPRSNKRKSADVAEAAGITAASVDEPAEAPEASDGPSSEDESSE